MPTYRVGATEGSYIFLIPFDSIVPEDCRQPKIIIGAEENQVERNVLRRTVLWTCPCVQ